MGVVDKLYHYRAIVQRVVDGDTIFVEIDWGNNHWDKNLKIRMLGINCPETKGATKAAGLQAKAFTESLLKSGQEVIIRTIKDEKAEDDFGRLLGEIFLLDGNDTSVNQALLESGNAVPFMV
jgi:micrococcal nuclease